MITQGYDLVTIMPIFRVSALFTAILLSGGQLFFPRIPLLVAFFVLMLIIRLGTKWRVSYAIMPSVILVVTVLMLEILRSGSGFEQVFIRAANFLCGLLLLNMYMFIGSSAFQRDIFSILRLFPFQTIGTVVLAIATPWLFVEVPEVNVHTLGLVFNYHSFMNMGFDLVRPDGFFWEPGILQLFLCLNLFFCLWVYKSPFHVLVTIIAILLTQSTTGLINLVFILSVYMFQSLSKSSGNKKKLGILMLYIIMVPIFLSSMANIEQKIYGKSKGSFYARNYDGVAGLYVALDHPWAGVGFNVGNYLEASRGQYIVLREYSADVFSEREGNSNGIITLFYTMGFPLGMLFFLGLIRQKALPSRFVVPTILVISLLSEPLTLFPFFLFLSFTGFPVVLYKKVKGSKKIEGRVRKLKHNSVLLHHADLQQSVPRIQKRLSE